MTMITYGTCGLCGGVVQTPKAYHSTPTCQKCGATAKAKDRPVLEMDPPVGWKPESKKYSERTP